MIACLFQVVGTCAKSTCQVYFTVKHKWTNKNFKRSEVKVRLCGVNGIEVDSVVSEYDDETFYFSIPKEGGCYVLTARKENMLPFCDTLKIKRFHRNEQYRELTPILLSPDVKTRNLNSAEVRATKVKFFHKNDTLVYNADAFNVAEGSMLDGLVGQLPGVELMNNGCIFVNGKRVESLLLNGEKFFNDDHELMLENLPAYTVKSIKVYDKAGLLSEMYKRDMGDKQYVMDVRLKRAYMVGLLSNIDAGGGTHDRYLASLFALRFTPCSRLAVVANVNNLNDERRPGENSDWTPEKMPTGLLATKLIGVDYLVKEKNEKIKAEGNMTVKYTSGEDYNERSREMFLPNGNWFARSKNQETPRRFQVNIVNTIDWRTKKEWYCYFSPNFLHSHSKQEFSDVSATFDADPSQWRGSDILDSMSMFEDNEQLLRHVLNRSINENKSSGNNTSILLPLSVNNIFFLGGQMGVSGSLSYNTSLNESFARRLIEYPNNPTKESDYQNVHTIDKPDYSLDYATNLSWACFPGKSLTMTVNYGYGQTFKHHDYEHHILSRLEGWSQEHMDEHPLGTLPSVVDYKLRTLDGQNSYQQNELHAKHAGNVYITYNGVVNLHVNLPVNFIHRRLNYYRGNHDDCTVYDGILRKNDMLFSPFMSVYKTVSFKKYDFTATFDYRMNQRNPEMTSYLECETTSDPLNIYSGNRELKKSTAHTLYLRLQVQGKTGWNVEIMPQYSVEANATAYGSTYDKGTGVRHYQPQNVNGNYMFRFPLVVSGDIDKHKRLSFHNHIWTTYTQGVDLVGDDDKASTVRSVVGTWNGMERLNLNYRMGKNSFGVTGTVNVNHSSSNQLDYQPITMVDFRYGLTATCHLPWDVQVSTDMTIYSRRGYSTAEANANNLVWNVRLSKKMPKSRLTFIVDGFDILGNLNNTVHTFNSQGRTEIYSNALPRYVMLHAVYRFHKEPKRD